MANGRFSRPVEIIADASVVFVGNVDFAIEQLVASTLHDRDIRLDNGWVIKIGRGLDFYQKPASWHEIGVHDLALRRCLETKVDVFRTNLAPDP